MDGLQSPQTTKQLFELLQGGVEHGYAEINYADLKYVIYARKSTTGDERQERSIPDQIKDCTDKVLNVAHHDKDGNKYYLTTAKGPISEKQSAKDPGVRPEFSQLIEDIKAGKIEGIIAWHPDRLSRNMKEAGEIIDLLDKGILKDIRFATSSFENSPTGKMLLGISFVLSKQYSEHLSESVARGNRRKTEEGVYFGKFKHGYLMNKQGQLYPDGDNFVIIQKAFEKRSKGITQLEIAKWLNKSGYQVFRRIKEDDSSGFIRASYTWDKDSVSTMLRDPIYAGVLKYGNALCPLEEFYDFTSLLSVSEFLKINKISDLNSSKLVSSILAKDKRTTKASLLNGCVFCGYCNKPFSSGLPTKILASGEKVYYYTYRCETDGCEFKNKSIRANKVLDYSIKFLGEHLFTTKSNYKKYKLDARDTVIQRNKELRSLISSTTRLVGVKKKELKDTKDLIRDHPELKEDYDLKEIKGEVKTVEEELKKLTVRLGNNKDAILSYEEYLELFKSISVKLPKMHDMGQIDETLKIFFSNWTVKATIPVKQRRYEITHKLNEPWEGFINSNNFDLGRGYRTRTCDLRVPNAAR